jgi:hypothetical protein
MAKRKKGKVEDLIGQLIQSELESHLSRMVKKSKKRAVRESAKLKDYLQLPYVKESEFVEAEVVEGQPEEDESASTGIKKNSFAE